MNLLITGGCGFIGSHLADRLVADGHGVIILDDLSTGKRTNAPVMAKLTQGDVADRDLVQSLAQEVDAIFHLAAIASVQVCEQEPERAARTNVLGTKNIFDAAAAQGIPVVYASSAAVYGDNPTLPLSEQAPPQPLGNYGKHKLENEHIALQSGLPSAGLRFFNVYGSRQDPKSPYSGVISIFVDKARAGEPIAFFGDGEQTRDFIHVSDVVELIVRAWKGAGKGRIFNGCTGEATSLKHLASVIGEAIGRPLATTLKPARAGDIRHSLGDPSYARTILDFNAGMPLLAGIKDLIRTGGDD